MPPAFSESTYAVLGLIDKRPQASGYELVALAERSLAHFWPVSQTLLYRELRRLQELGWVTATRVEQERKPSKWIYEVTADGRDALAGWLDTPHRAESSVRNGMILKLFFGNRMRPEVLRAMLADERASLQERRDELNAVLGHIAPKPGTRPGQLAARHGIRVTEAELEWLDEVEAELDGAPLSGQEATDPAPTETGLVPLE